jgi:DNA-binding response OmpR family regulator
MASIMVVDDAVDIRVLCREALGRAGHDVVTVAGGEEALTYLERAADLPDLVLLDVQMPMMDGWTVLREIRSRPQTAGLRVVMFSVKSRREDLIEGWTLGCDGYVSKPFNLDAWIREIEVALNRSDLDRERHRERTLETLTRGQSLME